MSVTITCTIRLHGSAHPTIWTLRAWMTRRGGNYVLFRPTPTYGTFTFNIALINGRRLQWVVNYIDERNHVLFQLDSNATFTRREVVNGRGGAQVEASHGIRKRDFTLRMDISPTAITHQLLYENANWKPIDTWKGAVAPNAKFGLYIPSRETSSDWQISTSCRDNFRSLISRLPNSTGG